MKTFVLLILTIFLFAGCDIRQNSTDSINPLIGNLSFESAFDRPPTSNDDPNLRIRTHLQFVHDFLTQKNKSQFGAIELEKREKMLALLQEYIDAGEFPFNQKYTEERRPCFIDDAGNRCAVAYLIENTSGSELAYSINDHFQYDLIQNMKGEELLNWIANSGLTKEEIEMIQPTYDFYELKYPNYAGVRYVYNHVLSNAFTSGPYTSIQRRYNDSWGLTFDLNTKKRLGLRFGVLNVNRSFSIVDHLSSNSAASEVDLNFIGLPIHVSYAPKFLRGRVKLEVGALSLFKLSEKMPERTDYIVDGEIAEISNQELVIQPSSKLKFIVPTRKMKGSIYVETSGDYSLKGYSNFHSEKFVTLGFGIGYHRYW